MARLAAAFYGLPSRDLPTVGVTGTNGKTTVTHLLGAVARARPGGRPTVIGTLDGARTTPEATELQRSLAAVRDGTAPRRAPGGGDGGVLPRAGPAPGGRHRLRRGRLHQPEPRPPRLPRDDGGVLRGQGVAVHAGPGRGGASSTPTTVGPPAAGRGRGADHVVARPGRRWPPRCSLAVGSHRRSRGAGSGSTLPLPALFNVDNALIAAGGRGRPRRRPGRRRRGAGGTSRPVPGRMEVVSVRADVRTARSRWSWSTTPTPRPGSRPSSPRPAGWPARWPGDLSCSAVAATATGRSARRWARWPTAAGRPWRS